MLSIEVFYYFFGLFLAVHTFVYPCQYLHANEEILECNRCQCTAFPSMHFCGLTLGYSCENHLDEIRMKINQIDEYPWDLTDQIEYHHFHFDLFLHEQFCQMKNVSQLTFFNTIVNQTSTCLPHQTSLRFAHSYLGYGNFSADKFVFVNCTFEANEWNWTSTKILIFHSNLVLHKPFQIQSLPLLTHLTISQMKDWELIGRFPHLSYLNLRSNDLTDQQFNRLLSQIHLPDLITLILSKNSLSSISPKIPSTVRYLDLSNNHIKSLDYYSFKSLYSLNMLNLSYNAPLEIQSDTFTRIPYLENLDLTSAFPTLPFDDLFYPLQKLRYLNISGNALDILPLLPVLHETHYDQHLPVLYIDLSKNIFEQFDWQIFSNQDKYILSFNLQRNRLKTLIFSANQTKRRGPLIELDIQYNPLQCDCHLYEQISIMDHSLPFFRYRRQSNHFISNRLKILHLANLTCSNLLEHRSLFELNSSNTFCTYENSSCPSNCSCRYSTDLTIHSINCSYQGLHEIPSNLPHSTTHLYLQYNQIRDIPLKIFSHLLDLQEVYLDHNIWIPYSMKEFQWNKHLFHLTYANDSLCNRSLTINRSLMMEDCCLNSRNEFCRIQSSINSTIEPILFELIDQKSLLFLLLIVLLLLCILGLISYIYRKKRLLFPDDPMEKPNMPFNDYSYTDEDDYASIPLTISQTDLNIPIKTISAPPLPPPRPVSHTSTTSTSITIHSNISPRLKFDVLLLYSLDDGNYVHQVIAQALEQIYDQRFTFYFLHRYRISLDIPSLIDNASIIVFILRKPYDQMQQYMKICSWKKCFLILINPDRTGEVISLKLREKIARLYQTSNIYQWNADPNALIHEQFEFFLEQNCRARCS